MAEVQHQSSAFFAIQQRIQVQTITSIELRAENSRVARVWVEYCVLAFFACNYELRGTIRCSQWYAPEGVIDCYSPAAASRTYVFAWTEVDEDGFHHVVTRVLFDGEWRDEVHIQVRNYMDSRLYLTIREPKTKQVLSHRYLLLLEAHQVLVFKHCFRLY